MWAKKGGNFSRTAEEARTQLLPNVTKGDPGKKERLGKKIKDKFTSQVQGETSGKKFKGVVSPRWRRGKKG